MDSQVEVKLSSKRELLRAAGELMTERGSVEISLSDIAARSGINSAMVKYYFGNKNGLLIALAEEVLGVALEQMDSLLLMPIPAIDKIKLHIRGIVTVYHKYPYINRLIHTVLQDTSLAKRMSESISARLARTQRILLEEAVSAGLIRPVDPMFFYFIILGACDHLFFMGANLQHVFGIERLDDNVLRAYTNTLINLVFEGMRMPG